MPNGRPSLCWPVTCGPSQGDFAPLHNYYNKGIGDDGGYDQLRIMIASFAKKE